jgi:hypothetical protein
MNNIIYIVRYILQYIRTNAYEQFLSDAHRTTLKSNLMNKDGELSRRRRATNSAGLESHAVGLMGWGYNSK